MESGPKYPTTIEPFTAADLPALPSLQPAGWGPISPHYELYLSKAFGHPVKAVRGASLAGVSNLVSFGDKAWLSHVVVAPDHRRQGIASALVRHLLDRADSQGTRSVSLIATDEGYPVYSKLGFEPEISYVFLETGDQVSFAPCRSIRAARAADHPAIRELDRQTCGEDRRELLDGHLAGGRVYQRRGRILGFWLPTLGEGPIAASHPEAGLELLKLKIGLQQKIALPIGNQAAHQFLLRHGYRETRQSWRMVRGSRFDWQAAWLYSRIGGNFG